MHVSNTVNRAEADLYELPDAGMRARFTELSQDAALRQAVADLNPVDVKFYEQAVREFKRRCAFFGIPHTANVTSFSVL